MIGGGGRRRERTADVDLFGSIIDIVGKSCCFPGAGWRILTPDQGMTGWEVKRIAETPNGAFWLATEDGVTMIRPDAPELRGGVAR